MGNGFGSSTVWPDRRAYRLGVTIEPETQFDLVREATLSRAPVAWAGWLFGVVALGLGLVRPVHWALLTIGVVLLGAMVVHRARLVRRRRRRRRRERGNRARGLP